MSPADFDTCKAEGGRVRTMPIKGGRYAHICFDKNGKSHMGEIKMRKEMQKQSKEMMKQ